MSPPIDSVPSSWETADRGASRRASPSSNALPSGMRWLVSRILWVGTTLSAALLAIGLAILYLRTGGSPTMGPVAPPFRSLLVDIAHLDPYAVLWLGLLVLVLTPLARVLVTVWLFSVDRDRAFAAMTIFVLLVLLASVVVGVSS
jgi:uncharacterized membrane protein